MEDPTTEEINNLMADNALTLVDPKAKEPKLFLENSPFSGKQLLHILQKTQARHIYKRPAKGGGTWDYVTGTYVKKVLNYVFGWDWDFQVVDKGVEGDCLWIQGRLTVKSNDGRTITKEQFGRADLKMKRDGKGYLDYGNDLKAASTDALKKCAAEFGIASDIYGKNEFSEVAPETKSAILNQDDPATSNQIDIIQTLLKNRKIAGAAVTLFLKKYKVTDLSDIKKGLAVQIIKDLQEG